MSLGRKRGFLGKYKHRTKRDPNYLNIWRKFLKGVNLDMFILYNPKLKKTHDQLKALKKQIREMEKKKEDHEQLHRMMPTWNPKRVKENNCEKGTVKTFVKMRKHRQKIKEKISLNYDRCVDSDTDSDDSYHEVNDLY